MRKAISRGLIGGAVLGTSYLYFKNQAILRVANQAERTQPEPQVSKQQVKQPETSMKAKNSKEVKEIREGNDAREGGLFRGKKVPDDYLVLIGTEVFREEFVKQIDSIASSLKAQRPSLQIVKYTREEAEAKGIDMGGQLLGFAKKKESEVLPISIFEFLRDSAKFSTYFADIRTIPSFGLLEPGKQDDFLVSCGNDSSGVKKLELLRLVSENPSVFNYADCSKLEGTPDDLFAIKKHGKWNSQREDVATEIDGKLWDVLKLPGFFKDFSKKNATLKIEELNRKINEELIVFNPRDYHDPNWLIILRYDFNSTSSKEKDNILSSLRDFYMNIPPEQRKKVALHQIHSRGVKRELTFTDQKSTRTFEGRDSARTKEIAEQFEKLNPKLISQPNASYVYAFPPGLEASPENLTAFFKEVNNGKVPDYHASEPKKIWKVSKKEVVNTLPNLRRDDKDHVIFVYSNYCETCKHLSPRFELAAHKNILSNYFPKLDFHRLNGNLNSLFDYAPVVFYLKKGVDYPIVMHRPHFTDDMIESFIKPLYQVKLEKMRIPNIIMETYDTVKIDN